CPWSRPAVPRHSSLSPREQVKTGTCLRISAVPFYFQGDFSGMAAVVKLRCDAGLNIPQAAANLGVSLRTAAAGEPMFVPSCLARWQTTAMEPSNPASQGKNDARLRDWAVE